MTLTIWKSLWHRFLTIIGIITTISAAYYYMTGDHLLHLIQHWP